MTEPRTLDVSHLPPGAFGHRSILWWGTMGIVLIDRSGFPENINGNENSADTFRLVGQRPIIGRDFESSDEEPGAAAG